MVIGDLSTAVDVLVIGGGPGGYVAAIRAAQLGKQVTLVDPGPLGGTCLNLGCIPSKALLGAADQVWRLSSLDHLGIAVGKPLIDFAKMQAWKDAIVERLSRGVLRLLQNNQVQFIPGKAWFISECDVRVEGEHGSQRFSFEHAVIAVGADPAALPGLAFDAERILTPGQALNLGSLPARLAIIGSDYIAAELATLYAKLGVAVRLLIPPGQALLSAFEPAAVRQVVGRLKKFGAAVEIDSTDPGDAERVVLSVGLAPRSAALQLAEVAVQTDAYGFITVNSQMQTSNPRIYAVGDATGGLALATTAIKQGKVAAEHLAGQACEYAPQALPQIAWTDPVLATVGLTASQAQNAGYDTLSARFPLAANGRALTLEASDGFAALIAERNSGALLGATWVGAGAEHLISEAALALEMGATLTDLAETLHPHPGLAEALQEAAEMALGFPVHTLKHGL